MREKTEKRIRRHKRIRKKIFGTKERPRLCVYRGLANLSAQLIDDMDEQTLLSISTQDKNVKKKISYGGSVKAAKILGEMLAEEAKKKGITRVIFDRSGFLYHGRLKALAESCREHGLEF
ncbi:MAG: 50S ribosomal protein L18 [Candidatus Omnitrophica bacterium]|nr:50S ribosomal protein L18 [Candidatus Omnitrophota bacterium]